MRMCRCIVTSVPAALRCGIKGYAKANPHGELCLRLGRELNRVWVRLASFAIMARRLYNLMVIAIVKLN